MWFIDGENAFDGRDDIVGFFRKILVPSLVGTHAVSQPEIELIGWDNATVIWRLIEAYHFTEANPDGAAAGLTCNAFPIYGAIRAAPHATAEAA